MGWEVENENLIFITGGALSGRLRAADRFHGKKQSARKLSHVVADFKRALHDPGFGSLLSDKFIVASLVRIYRTLGNRLRKRKSVYNVQPRPDSPSRV